LTGARDVARAIDALRRGWPVAVDDILFLAIETACCFWRPKPSHSLRSTRAPWRCAISTVSSLLPESTTRISSAKSTLARHGPIWLDASSAMMATVRGSLSSAGRATAESGSFGKGVILPSGTPD